MNGKPNSSTATDRYGFAPAFIYSALSLIFFGRALLGHFSERYLGNGPDPGQFMWYMQWWPYALSHHLNPFMPRIIWPPAGVNLAWTASMPLPSLVAYPLTRTIGLIPTFNLLCLLCPVLAGWTAFLLCRLVTQSYWSSMLGGFIFGFSAHMLGKTFGNLNDALVFTVPLTLYVALLWFKRRIGTGTLVALLTLLLTATFLCFIETFATLTLFGGVALLLGIALADQATRNRLFKMLKPVALSYVATLVLVSPYLYFLFAHPIHQAEFMPVSMFAIDPVNFFLPTPLNELGQLAFLRHITAGFEAQLMESGGYIALPIIVIAVLFAHRYWHTLRGRLICDFLIVALLFSMGPHLQFLGHTTAIALPWSLFTKLPFIKKALPARFMLYVFLDLALMVSIWLSEWEAGSPAKFSLAAAIAVFMLPNLTASFWAVDANVPTFFSTGLYKQYLAPHENVIILPYSINGDSMLWQARADMYFNMVEGWTGYPLVPTQFENWPIIEELIYGIGLPNAQLQLRGFLARYNIGAIIMVNHCFCTWQYHPNDSEPGEWLRAGVPDYDLEQWKSWIADLAAPPVAAGSVLVYRINPQHAPHREPTQFALRLAATEYRFSALVRAAALYDQAGYNLSRLSPMHAKRLHLLPPGLISRDLVFNRAPEDSPVLNDLLLTRLDNGRVAVGVVAPYLILRQIVKQFGCYATTSRYISMDPPHAFVRKPTGKAPLLLIMQFDRENLLKGLSYIENCKISLFPDTIGHPSVAGETTQGFP